MQIKEKPQARKRIFVQTTSPHCNLKLREKNSRRTVARLFAPFPVSAWSKTSFQFDFKKQTTKRRKKCSRTTSGSSNQLQPASVGGGESKWN